MPVNNKDLLDTPDILANFSEGNIVNPRSLASLPTPNTTFKRMVVLEVISDPVAVLDPAGNKIEYWRNVLGVSNMKFASVLPRNTIVAQFAYSDIAPMFVFPFFPSHLSLPCKPGELVWSVVEDPEATRLDLAYWMCRITEPHTADDVNHTHAPRSYDVSFAGIDKASKVDRTQNDGKTDPWYELRNGQVVLQPDGTRRTEQNGLLLSKVDTDDYFEQLVRVTDGAKLSQYEAVPRFKKRPGDVVLEGSNNSLIVLGTDRKGPVGDFQQTPGTENGPQPSKISDDLSGDAGSIDLVVGRGQTAETLGKEVSTTTIFGSTATKKGTEIKKELGKAEDELSPKEGDPDLTNDRSRVQISQRTKVDKNFGLDVFNSTEFEVEDSATGDSAIVIKTDKIRLIARSDIEIIVTGFKPSTNVKGQAIKTENSQDEDDGKFAAIIIKSNGDIIFKPSDTGYIKLGDADADRALLCTDTPAVLLPTSVSPATPPLTNTMGGKLGGTGIPTQGTWASKVLVTGANASLGGEIG